MSLDLSWTQNCINLFPKLKWINLQANQLMCPVGACDDSIATHPGQPSKQKIEKWHTLDGMIVKMSLLASSSIWLIRKEQ
jgi:hypothetical protein